ncbi:MAG TPA: PKD domain-containing protein, partial [Gemmatimonadaceae bacterium]|nr:PKD domain-containing protein [Gemmatimonadaceae bacterium]
MRPRPARVVWFAAVVALTFVSCRDLEPPTAPRAMAPPPAPPSLDLVSPTAQVLVGAGNIASCSTTNDDATATLLDNIPGTVFTAGDNAYSNGTDTEFANCYGPTWGRHKARTRPAVGSKDYGTTNALGYFRYFGAAAGDSAKYYYSYDLADWHVVVLNSKLSTSATSAQVSWLKADLQASTKRCTVAIFNRPYYSSPSGTYANLKPVWDVLYAFGVELTLHGYNRDYERFAPQDANGNRDDAQGVREFVVGTGGAGTTSFSTIAANSEVRSTGTAGVLKLTLDAGTYGWEFVPVPGKTFTDAGTGSCHDAPPPIAKPGGPYAGEGSLTFDGSASTDPQGELPLSYAWDFGDGTTGTGAKPTHTYAVDGVYTVTLVVSDAKGNPSAPATTTATIQNQPPVVNAGPSQSLMVGKAVTLNASFTDAGVDDGPWTWRIAWGDGTPDEVGSAATQPGPIVASHSYADVGSYTATVYVTDKDGGQGQDDA